MAQFPGKPVVAVHHFAINDNTAAYTRSQGNLYEILHAFGCTVDHFSLSCGIGIVGDHDRQPQGSFHRLFEVDHFRIPVFVFCPLQVGSHFYGAFIVISIGSPNTYSLDFFTASHGRSIDDPGKCFLQFIHIPL